MTLPQIAFADISPATLSVPHTLDVDPLSGEAVARVPVPLPPGRAGFGPAFTLEYRSRSGNSPFGAGWSLSGLPIVSLDTGRSLPRYDGTDLVQFGFGGEMVPALVLQQGEWAPRIDASGAFWIRHWRARREASSIRLEQWTEIANGRVHWRSRDGANTLTIFGQRADDTSRIADPEDASRVLIWLPDAQLDSAGNAIVFEYLPEDARGVDHTAPWEQGRHRAAPSQRYLKSVRYGNTEVVTEQTPHAPGNRWSFTVVFDYGDHRTMAPASAPDQAWAVRPDPFSNMRGGFDLRTWRLCRRILTFHAFDELGPQPILTREFVLHHDLSPGGSELQSIEIAGFRTDLTAATVERRVMPALVLSYSQPKLADAFIPAPLETGENAAGGLSGGSMRWIDLFCDGLPGLLSETDTAWYFKPNEGGGRFGALQLVALKPSSRRASFSDFNGDGRLDSAVLHGRTAGYYERELDDGEWRGFRPIGALPHVEAALGRAQWVDLTGDGRQDLLVSDADHVTWFAARDDEQFGEGLTVARTSAGAPVVEDPALGLFFADLNGDGLADQVRVRNGAIEYWPQLGHGRFADTPTVMEGAPVFAPDHEFDPRRVRFVKLTAHGGADLCYVGSDAISFWKNAQGNRWLQEVRRPGVGVVDTQSSIAVLDFLGNGCPCLVWSSPLATVATAMQYLPLTDSVPPGFLLSIDNGLGRITEVTYASSAHHYLRDRQGGRAWRAHPAQHVIVAERLKVIDQIGDTFSESRYEYHDGYYDTHDRRFVGFGLVDRFDAEYSNSSSPDIAPGGASCERIWFHPGGAIQLRGRLTDAYSADPDEPILSALEIETPAVWSDEELNDAISAAAGRVIRTERYAVDAKGVRAAHPIETTQHGFVVRRQQPSRGVWPASVLVYAGQTISSAYEGQPADPRTAHELSLEVDRFGLPTVSATIAYRRRPGVAPAVPSQAVTQISVERRGLLHRDETHRLQLGVILEIETFEIAGLPPPSTAYQRLALAGVVGPLLATPTPHHQSFAGAGPAARRLTWEQHFYWDAMRTAAAPFGGVGTVVLPHHTESAAFAEGFVATAFGARVDAPLIQSLGYVRRDGHWWQSEPVQHFLPAAGFSLPERVERSSGGVTTTKYDDSRMFSIESVDPVGNRVRGEIDYQVLAPSAIIDANGTRSEARYDALGVITLSTVRGDILDENGVAQPLGHEPLSAYIDPPAASFAAILAAPANFVQSAALFRAYDLNGWRVGRRPASEVVIVRERLVHDGRGTSPAAPPVKVQVSYFDGFGREQQVKVLAESGSALQRDAGGLLLIDGAGRPVEGPAAQRWMVSGGVVYDRAQRPVRRFEPFYSVTPSFEAEPVLLRVGASLRVGYDALGRTVREDLPNGCYTRKEYHAWEVRHFDANDTIADAAFRTPRAALSASDPERMALAEADTHADTPSIHHLDPTGRDVRQVDRNPGGVDRVTTGIVNMHGRTVELVDPRGMTSTRIGYDMLDRIAVLDSADAGTRWTLADAQDRTRHVWDAVGVHQEISYDELDRVVTVHVNGPGFSRLAEQRIYGDDASFAQGAQRNARGQLVLHRDQAGVLEVEAYDLSGRACRVARKLCTDYRAPPDWQVVANVGLDAETFRSTSAYDALGRPIEQTFPDGSRRMQSYAAGGGLRELSMDTDDGVLSGQTLLTDASFNARGQQIHLRLGNGVVVAHDYDPLTYWPRSVKATRASQGGVTETLQDLRYVYDPNGRLVYLSDAAQELGASGVFLTGGQVSPASTFKYDHFGQLIQASGRVHQALLEHDYRPALTGVGALKGTRHLMFNNAAALERYTRTYRYDASGNLLQMRHAGQTQSWTSDFWVSAVSNRSLPATDANGIALQTPDTWFDANGNCRYLPNVRRVEWTDRNMIASALLIERPAGPNDIEYYVYDGNNLRVRKVTERLVNQQLEITEHLYLDGCDIKRVRLGGQLQLERLTSHISDGYTRVALVNRWRVDTLARETNDTTRARIRYQLSTHVGSASLELDETGARVSYEEYFPFGATAFIAGDAMKEVDARAYRYCGKERDDSTGLYYFEYRYYAAWIGRWMSPDPSGPDESTNLYLYAENDPVNAFDPEGLDGRRRAAPSLQTQHIPWDSLPAQYREQGDRSSTYFVLYGPSAAGPSTYTNFATMQDMQAAAKHTPGAWVGVYDPRWQRHYEAAQSEGRSEEASRAKAQALLEVDDLVASIITEDVDRSLAELGGDGAGGGDATTKKPKQERGGETGQDGTAGATKDATGATAGDKGTTASSDAGGSNTHDGDGSSTTTTPPGTQLGGQGTGHSGTGPGAGQKGTGRGGGGEGTGIAGGGTTGEGKDRGKGAAGKGSGAAANLGSDTANNPTPAGTGTGTGADGVPGGVHGGSSGGSLEGVMGGTGRTPGSGTTGGKGGGGQTSSGDFNGDPNGSPTGSPKGITSGTASGTGGMGGDGQTASGSGKKGGVAKGTGTNSDAQGTGRDTGQPPTGDTGPGKSGQQATLMDKITTVAGYTNLEFGESENGQSGGVPGGMGTHNWGAWGQSLYVALSVVGVVLMFFGGAGIKAALRASLAGTKTALLATARLFTKEGLKRVGAKLSALYAKHSIEVAFGRGAIKLFPVHAAWKAGGRWLHAFGSKPLFAAQQLVGKFRAGLATKGIRAAWSEAWSEFGPKLLRFQTVMTRNAEEFAETAVRFRLPALFPQLATKAEGRMVLSCLTSTWNAWSRTNLHLPNLLLAGGGGYGLWRWFGGGSGDAPQHQEGSTNAGAR